MTRYTLHIPRHDLVTLVLLLALSLAVDVVNWRWWLAGLAYAITAAWFVVLVLETRVERVSV